MVVAPNFVGHDLPPAPQPASEALKQYCRMAEGAFLDLEGGSHPCRQARPGGSPHVDMLADVRQRNPIGRQLAQRSHDELLAAVLADHRRTLEWLRSVEPSALLRRASIGAGRTLSAEDVLRLGLCRHLEIHLDQLEWALASLSRRWLRGSQRAVAEHELPDLA